MFDELFIKEMSSIDAYNYGRQMMEKELNKLGECEYNKGRADAETEQKAMCESCIHKVSADDIETIRNSAIDECIEVVERYTYDCSIIEKLERLKESKE